MLAAKWRRFATVGAFFGVTTRRSRDTIAHSAILAKTDQQQHGGSDEDLDGEGRQVRLRPAD